MPNKFFSATGTYFLRLSGNASFEFNTEEQFFTHPHIVHILRFSPGMTLYKTAVGDGYEIVGHYPHGITRVLGYIKNDIPTILDIDTIVEPIEYDPFVHGCRCNIL